MLFRILFILGSFSSLFGIATDLRCITVLMMHSKEGGAGNFSSDSKTLLLPSPVAIRDGNTGELLSLLREENGDLVSGARYVLLNPTGKYLFTWWDRGGHRLWEIDSGRQIWPRNPARETESEEISTEPSFSPDGKFFAVSKAAFTDVIDLSTLERVGRVYHPTDSGRISRLAFDGGVNYGSMRLALATANANPSVLVYEFSSGDLIQRFDSDSGDDFTDLRWVSESGRQRYLVAVCDRGYQAYVFDSQSGAFNRSGKIFSIGGWPQVSADGRYLLGKRIREGLSDAQSRNGMHRTGEFPQLAVWDVASGREIGQHELPQSGGLWAIGKLFVYRGIPFGLYLDGLGARYKRTKLVVVDMKLGTMVAQIDGMDYPRSAIEKPRKVIVNEAVRSGKGAEWFDTNISPNGERLVTTVTNGKPALFDMKAALDAYLDEK